MDSQNFDPTKFIAEVEKLCGTSIPPLSEVAHRFAVSIGDQSKLERCLNKIKILTKGLPQDVTMLIFDLVFMVHFFSEAEKYCKPPLIRARRRLTKKRHNYWKKFNSTMKYLKGFNPDPSIFDEGYWLNLAKEKAVEMKLDPQTTDEIIKHFIEQTESIGTMVGQTIFEKKNPKGNVIVNLFIYKVYSIVKYHGLTLTKTRICSCIASLLTILTGKECSTQNVLKILRPSLKTP